MLRLPQTQYLSTHGEHDICELGGDTMHITEGAFVRVKIVENATVACAMIDVADLLERVIELARAELARPYSNDDQQHRLHLMLDSLGDAVQ